MGTWIEVCKVGTWTAKNGKNVSFSRTDLDTIVDTYNPNEREAPLVFGHPGDNEPAFGWTEKFKRVGNILMAKLKDVPETVKQIVNAKLYKKISLSLGADKKTVRHIGLLGAVQPAVPGLADVKFKDGEEAFILEFSNPNEEEQMEKKELEEKLAAEKTARKAAEKEAEDAKTRAETAENELSDSKQNALETKIDTRINSFVGKKIKAGDKPVIKKIALALGDCDEFELSQGAGKKGLDEHLFDFLSGLQDLGLDSEFNEPGDGGDDDPGVSPMNMMDKV